jgi:hypothetical protein
MTIKQVPIELDWVDARCKCSLYEMYKRLRNEVKEDVKKRNDLRKEGERVRFEFGAESAKGFSVFREGLSGPTCIDFAISETEMSVAMRDQVILSATATVNDEGRCMFVVKGKELENWQVRKLALEELFFSK